MKNYSYQISLVISQMLSAVVMFICLSGKAPIWMYLAFAIPPLLLFALLLLGQKPAALITVPFWLIFIVCFLAFWFNPTAVSLFSNTYSITAIVFFLLTTVFSIGAPRSKPNPFFGVKTPMTDESPEIWAKVHSVCGVVSAAFVIPLFLLIFYISGGLNLGLCYIFILAAVIGGGAVGQIAARPLLRQLQHREEEQLKEAIKKEQGYRN